MLARAVLARSQGFACVELGYQRKAAWQACAGENVTRRPQEDPGKSGGAREGTRTPTPLLASGPKPGASTNFATLAVLAAAGRWPRCSLAPWRAKAKKAAGTARLPASLAAALARRLCNEAADCSASLGGNPAPPRRHSASPHVRRLSRWWSAIYAEVVGRATHACTASQCARRSRNA